MKKIITMIVGIVLFSMTTAVQAQEAVAPLAEISPKPRVEYTLPYPGMLPDNPLYFLKKLRDTVMEKVIADPMKKAEFYVLQADKRLVMGQMLAEQKKNELTETTVSKGSKYMIQAMDVLKAQKMGGNKIPSYMTNRMGNSVAKHLEVLEELKAKAGANAAGIDGTMGLLKQVQSELSTFTTPETQQ